MRILPVLTILAIATFPATSQADLRLGDFVYDAWSVTDEAFDSSMTIDTMSGNNFSGSLDGVWTIHSGVYSSPDVTFSAHTDHYGVIDIDYTAKDCFGFAGRDGGTLAVFQGDSGEWVGTYVQQTYVDGVGWSTQTLHITSATGGVLTGHLDGGAAVSGTYNTVTDTFTLNIPSQSHSFAGTFGTGWVGTWIDLAGGEGVFLCRGFVPSVTASISAGSMIMRSDGLAHDGDGWGIWSAGFIGTFIELADPGIVTVTVRACGQAALGTPPKMDVHLGDETITYDAVDNGSPYTTYTSYTYDYELPAGTHALRVAFTNDYYDGTNDRNLFVKDVTFAGHPVTVVNNDNEATALAAADTYIDNYRKGPAEVTLLNADGTPVAAGKQVKIRLRNHAFDWGTSMFGGYWWHPQTWWMDNPDPVANPVEYKTQWFINNRFNMLVPDYGGKLMWNERDRGVFTLDFIDNMVAYCQARNWKYRAHCVLWEGDWVEPDWWKELKYDALDGVPGAADEYWQEMIERIDYYVADRAAGYDHIDGINEAIHANPMNNRTLFGLAGEVDLWKEIYNAAAGQALVFANDFQVLNDVRAGDRPDDYANWYAGYISNLERDGATIDGVGVQAHMIDTTHHVFRDFQVLQNLARLHKPVVITEFSAGPEESADDILSHTMRLAFGNDAVTGFLLWGFWEGGINRTEGRLLNMDWTRTDAGWTYDYTRAAWNTKTSTTTDANGKVSFTGFYGEYDIVIDNRTYPMTLVKGADNYTINLIDADSEYPVADFSDVQHWVGTGAKQAAMVVDFNDGLVAESMVWGYRWDDTATSADMFNAIVAADPRLYGLLKNHLGWSDPRADAYLLAYDRQDDGAIDGDDHNAVSAHRRWYLSHLNGASVWELADETTEKAGAWTLSDGDWDGYAFGEIPVVPDGTAFAALEPVTGATGERTIMADQMVTKTAGGKVLYNDGYCLWNDGYLRTYIKLDQAGTLDVTVKATGEQADSVLPIMDLYVGSQSASWNVTDFDVPYDWYTDYTASVTLPAGWHEVTIEFSNDFYGEEDRNLYVLSATFANLPVTIFNVDDLAVDADLDDDGDVDQIDFSRFQRCIAEPGFVPADPICATVDYDADSDVDGDDFLSFHLCESGPAMPAPGHCQ